MRRRSWTFIQQCDIMISFQMGLPSMVDLRALEPCLPRNIHDEDEAFGEDCTSLPPALPDSTPTRISYLIAKARLAFGFARALQEVSRAPVPKWERVLEIDRDLRQIYDNVPSHYKLSQLSGEDSLVLVSARFVLLSIHHKSLCVVHSRFLGTAKFDDRFIYSRRVCLTSAMTILRFQAIQDQEIPVNGRLRSLTNYQTSLAIHDYLLAATIISADLYADNSSLDTKGTKGSEGIPTRNEMIKALRTAAGIFGRSQMCSMEAHKAASVLQMIVRRVESGVRHSTRTSKAQGHSSRPEGAPATVSSYHRSRSLQTSSSTSDAACSTTGGLQGDRVLDAERRVQYAILTPSSSSQDPQSAENCTEAVRLIERPDLDAFTAWSDSVNGVNTTQMPTLHQHSQAFEFSAEVPSNVCQRTPMFAQEPINGDAANFNHSTHDWLSFPTTLSLSDPMASLWTMCSVPQEDLYMD
jgi:hypothetical protein